VAARRRTYQFLVLRTLPGRTRRGSEARRSPCSCLSVRVPSRGTLAWITSNFNLVTGHGSAGLPSEGVTGQQVLIRTRQSQAAGLSRIFARSKSARLGETVRGGAPKVCHHIPSSYSYPRASIGPGSFRPRRNEAPGLRDPPRGEASAPDAAFGHCDEVYVVWPLHPYHDASQVWGARVPMRPRGQRSAWKSPSRVFRQVKFDAPVRGRGRSQSAKPRATRR
jgi:hypothetical protein